MHQVARLLTLKSRLVPKGGPLSKYGLLLFLVVSVYSVPDDPRSNSLWDHIPVQVLLTF
jgi:hypothetical protein